MKGFNISSFEPVSRAIELCSLYKSIGCDTIRYQFNAPFYDLLLDRAAYRTWLSNELNKLTEISYNSPGLNFIADLHATYGGVSESTREAYIMTEDGRTAWLDDLLLIEQAVRSNDRITGIDIVNEPWSRPIKWRRFLESNRDFLKGFSQKKIYIEPPYGIPTGLQFLPKIARNVIPSAHVWPEFSLRLDPFQEVIRADEKAIQGDACLSQLRKIKAYEGASRRKVMIGELGITFGVGSALQRMYMRKAISFCLKNKLQVCIHGEAGNPHYNYEQAGVLDVIADLFRAK